MYLQRKIPVLWYETVLYSYYKIKCLWSLASTHIPAQTKLCDTHLITVVSSTKTFCRGQSKNDPSRTLALDLANQAGEKKKKKKMLGKK